MDCFCDLLVLPHTFSKYWYMALAPVESPVWSLEIDFMAKTCLFVMHLSPSYVYSHNVFRGYGIDLWVHVPQAQSENWDSLSTRVLSSC